MKWTIAIIWSNKPQGYSRWLKNPMRYEDSVKVNILAGLSRRTREERCEEVGYGLKVQPYGAL